MQLINKLKEKFSSLSGRSSKIITASAVMLAAIIIAAVFFIKNKEEPETVTYDYNKVEQQIADEVMAYLSLYLDLPDDVSAQIADAAVQNYNAIINSNVDIVRDEHTEAIKQRIRFAIVSLLDEESAAAMTDDDLDGLSSGAAEIIWNAILSQIEKTTTEGDYKEEYLYLAESIQNQINELEERRMKVSIQANIKNNPDIIDMDAESLLAIVNDMTDEELQALAKSLGLSLEELQALLSSNAENLKDGIEKNLEKELAALKKEFTKEITNQIQTSGINNSRSGRDGRDGKSGKDGQNGTDGKTTYIAYADDISGAGFSLTPTETSKYVGTCVTSENSQPQNYSAYSNWQIYRTYIITTTTDENGITTMHIN